MSVMSAMLECIFNLNNFTLIFSILIRLFIINNFYKKLSYLLNYTNKNKRKYIYEDEFTKMVINSLCYIFLISICTLLVLYNLFFAYESIITICNILLKYSELR